MIKITKEETQIKGSLEETTTEIVSFLCNDELLRKLLHYQEAADNFINLTTGLSGIASLIQDKKIDASIEEMQKKLGDNNKKIKVKKEMVGVVVNAIIQLLEIAKREKLC